MWAISGEISPGGRGPDARRNPDLSGKAGAARGEVGAIHSGDESRNEAGAKGPHLNTGNSGASDEAMAPLMGIVTPPKVEALQRTLYRKAKEDRRWRAWSLHGELCRRDVLATALKAVVKNGGAAGLDGITTEQVQARAETFLDALQIQLKDQSYKPGPVMRVGFTRTTGSSGPWGFPTSSIGSCRWRS